MEPKQLPPYPLRMPQELREALEKEAALGKRSLNAEVVGRLELTLARQQEEHGELLSRKRALSRQILELRGQLIAAEEVQLARDARVIAQMGKDPSSNQLAPLQEAARQAGQVVEGFRLLLDESHSRLSKLEEQLSRAIELGQRREKKASDRDE